MKPRHFWALYNSKAKKRKKPATLTAKDAKRLRLLLERKKHAAAAKRSD